MAELSKADLGKRGNEDTMVKKFLHMNGSVDTFLHKDGQFKPHAMVIVMDDEEHAIPLVGFGRCPGMLSVALFLGLPAASAVVLHQ